MAYQKQEWHDLPLEDTPISAERLTHMEDGIYEAWEHGGGSGAPIGAIIPYGGTVAPNGYLICDGSQYLKTEYPDLYGVIGTTFNEENDGELHFRVPDLRDGKVPVGMGGDGPYSIGATGGEEEHTLTTGELPKVTVVNNVGIITCGSGSQTLAVNSSGGQAHNNMPPYVATNYIIKALDEPSGEKLSETMPIGSEIDYDGLTVPDGWERVPDANLYSTNEVKIGTWGDKPLYRKVYSGDLSQSTIPHGLTDFSIKRIYGYFYNSNSNNYFPLPSTRPDYPAYEVGVYVSGTNINLERGSGAQLNTMTFEIVLEYTKTTNGEA